MFVKNSFKTLIIASVYLLAGAFFTLQAKEKEISPAKVDSRPAPAVSRLGGDLQKHSLGIGVGQTFLYSKLEDNGDDKITVDLYYNYSASYTFDFMANFHVSSHTFGETRSEISGLALGIKAKAYQIDNFSPFALAGLGFYNPKITRVVNNALLESTSKLVFGIHLGVGTELKLNEKFTLGLMGHYHDPFDVRQEIGPKVEGNYFKLLITSFYTF